MGRSFPYYIIAPRYTRTSAGVRVLYRLADLINRRGGRAYIFLWPGFGFDAASSPLDIAPFLTCSMADFHFSAGEVPIVISPEVVNSDKFFPPVVIKYFLNYFNLLADGGESRGIDFCICYGERVLSELGLGISGMNLFIPVSDAVFFHPPDATFSRTGGVIYAGKYKYRFNGKTFALTEGMPEITRDRLDSQSPEQIRSLFQSAEFFYCYEDSALAIEAILCGCPTVFLPNEHFKGPLGAKELGGLGYAVGTSPEQLAHAKATVGAAREHYLKLLAELGPQVDVFIEATQKMAAGRPYTKRFAEGYLRPPGILQRTLDLSRFMRDVIEDRGWIGTLKVILKRIRAGRFKI